MMRRLINEKWQKISFVQLHLGNVFPFTWRCYLRGWLLRWRFRLGRWGGRQWGGGFTWVPWRTPATASLTFLPSSSRTSSPQTLTNLSQAPNLGRTQSSESAYVWQRLLCLGARGTLKFWKRTFPWPRTPQSLGHKTHCIIIQEHRRTLQSWQSIKSQRRVFDTSGDKNHLPNKATVLLLHRKHTWWRVLLCLGDARCLQRTQQTKLSNYKWY